MDEKRAKEEYRSSIKALITEIAIVLAAVTILFTFVFGIHIQKGQDMYPALKDGDIVIYYRTHKVSNTEAIVYEADNKKRTGRVVATEGSEIGSTGELQMIFDGNFLPISPGNGIYQRTYAREDEVLPVTVEKDCCFILGDNRDEAKDSRDYGQINQKDIKGRIITVIRKRMI